MRRCAAYPTYENCMPTRWGGQAQRSRGFRCRFWCRVGCAYPAWVCNGSTLHC